MNPIVGKDGWVWRDSIDGRQVTLKGPDGRLVCLSRDPIGFTVQVVDGPKRWVAGPFEVALRSAVEFAEGVPRNHAGTGSSWCRQRPTGSTGW